MKPLSLPFLLCALVATVAISSAEAQQIPSAYRFIDTGQEAGALVGTIDPGRGRFDVGPGEGVLYGLRYSIELSGPFSLEGVARTLSSTRDVRDPRRPEGERKIGEADALLTSVDGRIKFSLTGRRTWHHVGPYVFAGGGVLFDLADAPAVEEELLAEDRYEFGTSFMGILGTGLRWIPADHLQVRADAGLNLWQVDTPEGYRDPERDLGFESPPESEWVSGLGLTVGIAFRW